jgi:hypothetical protein
MVGKRPRRVLRYEINQEALLAHATEVKYWGVV